MLKKVLACTSNAATRDRTRDLWIFNLTSLTLSHLSYHGLSVITLFSQNRLESFLYLCEILAWINKILKNRFQPVLLMPGSNQGPLDLQSNALPTELSRLVDVYFCSRGVLSRIVSLSTSNLFLDQQNSEKQVLACTSNAATRDRTRDLQIFGLTSLTLSHLSYHGLSVITLFSQNMLESFLCLCEILAWTNKILKNRFQPVPLMPRPGIEPGTFRSSV